ncbi:hypothetical protein L1887_32517 [Cichorium endivia]|nr:hypothetical protein L1887_32517 [Cichorium endivia]
MADQSRPVTGDPAPSAAGHRKTATVHPYVSPTPDAPQNQGAYYSDPYASQQWIPVVNRFFCIFVVSISCTGTIIFIIWLIWLSRISYPQFRVETLILSNISSDYPDFSECDGSKNETVIRARFTSLMYDRFTSLMYDLDYMINGEKGHEAIILDVWMEVRVQFSPWGDGRSNLAVHCSIAVSSKSNNGTLMGGPKNCTVTEELEFEP